MRKKKLIISFLFIALMFFVGKVSAYNYETTEVRLYSLRNNFKVCVKSPLLTTEHNLYIWSTFDSDRALQAWPGITMTQENDQIYCYTHNASDNVRYDYAIFNGNSKQTVDLNTINDSKGIINALLYKFDESGKNNDNKYVGAWYVYDTSKLVELVNVADSLDKNQYTIESYNRVKEVIGDKVSPSDVTLDNYNNYNLGAYYVSKLNDSNDILDKLIINYSDSENRYSAFYVDKYNELALALNQLEKRKDIVVDSSITGGTISASYNANSDTSITINANSNTGYRLKSIRVSKIVSYDVNNQPVLGDYTDIDINNQTYTYSFQSTDSMVGVYVTGVFEKNKYRLTFQVGENGTISTMNDGEILSPVTVEYDDDYSLKVIANEGYKVNKILVDGVEYQLTNGVLTIENVRKDTDVTISFSIKTFTIKYGTDEYTVEYGTTYSQLLNIIDTSKTGYKLNYITDKNNVRLDDNFVVTENNELTGNYSKLTYRLTFQVGENGTISTMEDGEVLSPVTVEYDDDYNLKIKANEGYKVNKVLVDGVEYQLTNGVLTIKNIKKDTNVVISFSLKTYNVKIDDKDYSFAYGTSYEDILKSINTNKDGYKFVGLKDKDGNLLDNNYKVKNNIELITVFESIKKDSNNPYTVDSIVKYVLIFVVSAVLFTFVSYILLVKLKRKNG